MSFLHPEPLPRRKKILMSVVLGMALLVAADTFKLIDLHGFGIPVLMSIVVFTTISLQGDRGQEDGNG